MKIVFLFKSYSFITFKYINNGDIMKINFKKLILIIIGTILVGSVFSFCNNMEIFDTLIKPPLQPPSIVFPIVWFILYTLMGISIYIISESNNYTYSVKLYIIQLIVNSLWALFFFCLNLRFFSFIWILLLIVLVVLMIIEFYKINKISAYLQIPYLLWLFLAAYLNLGIYLLNR